MVGAEGAALGWAALTAGLLPLCRKIGDFAVLPLAWHALTVALPGWFERVRGWGQAPLVGRLPSSGAGPKAGDAGEAGPSTGVAPAGRARWVPWLLVGMPVLGWGVYLTLMWHWTGNPFEGFAAQKHWGVHSIGNLVNVPKFIVGFFTPTQWHEFTGSLLDRCVFVLLLCTLPVLWRLDKGLVAWAYMLGILPAMSGTFTSFTRYASCAFPMFIALGVVLSRREWRGLRYALLVVFVVLHVVLVWRFVNFRWAG